MNIDEININIFRQLQDGKKSFKAIAEELSIAENTVRIRVTKLIEEGVLKISGLVDPELLPGHMTFIVGIRLKTMDSTIMAEELSRLKGVISASVVTGRFDIILIVSLNEQFGLAEFFKKELDPVKNILSAETFMAYKSYNLKVPYLL